MASDGWEAVACMLVKRIDWKRYEEYGYGIYGSFGNQKQFF